jgi:hypothetical protein
MALAPLICRSLPRSATFVGPHPYDRPLVEVGTWSRQRLTLNGERNEQVHALRVSAGFLPMLGVNPSIGRFFTAAEDESPTSAVLVSYEAWQRRFGGSPPVLGRQVSLNETTWTIVGVLPDSFRQSVRRRPIPRLPCARNSGMTRRPYCTGAQ